MQAGAGDYLIKPFTSDEVVTAIKRAFEKERRRRHQERGTGSRLVTSGKVITFYSPHDGAGKTTLAANLAVSLANQSGLPVALVDLNLQFGDLDLVLNLNPERTIADVVPHFQHLDAGLMETFLTPHESGVRLMAAPPRPQYAETVTVYCVQQVLRVLKEGYAYVVVDAASVLNDITLAALDLSDEIVLVTSLDVPSLRNARICLETLRDLHYPKERIRVVINRATGELGIKADEVEEYLEHPTSARIPSEGRVVVASVNRGVPFVTSHPESRVSAAVNELARSFMPTAEADVRPQQPPRRRLGVLVRELLGVGSAG
jgi:pilus assembly protein CpaE